uniref:Cytochrome P450 family 4 protein n=1 Tax=Sternaspis scutata TaxID=36133 RepID=A0A097F1W2_9ANNE|nr:cytochrome P450 family 4 protein [Sternaspis scutata]
MAGAGLVIAFVVAVISFLVWVFQPTKTKRMLNQIPGPPALPLIGNAHMLKPGGSEFYQQILEYTQMFDKDGILRLRVGLQPSVALYKPETVEVVLHTKSHITKSQEYRFLHPWVGTGLLTSTGDKWKMRRRLLTPTFHFRILYDFLQVFNEQSAIMVQRLEKQVDKGEFDMFPFITLCALDIICDTAMGKHVNAQADSDSKYVKAVYKMSELVHRRQKSPWFWPDVIYNSLPQGKQQQECLQILHGFTKAVIRERQSVIRKKIAEEGPTEPAKDDLYAEGGKKRMAFLDMLIYAAEGGANMTDEDIREEVDTFMFEGHDTTAAAANWAVHLLGANPEIQQKVQDELDDIFRGSDRPATMEDLADMKYLECCIKEALRLFPSVPMFARTISEDCVIGGYDVPEGTTAVVVTAALHRDPDHFPDPEKYDPDRWLPENCASRHPYCFIPFSAGLRNCIGQKFAMKEEKVVVSSILRRFNIKSMQTRADLLPMGELILRPQNGIRVKLTRRQQ